MRPRTKPRRLEYVRRRAYELARSGLFSSYQVIEWELRFEEDLLEARDVLDDERTRDELDRLCKEAKQQSGNA